MESPKIISVNIPLDDSIKTHSHDYRLGLRRAILAGDITIKPCDMDKLFDTPPLVLPHTTSSHTVNVIGRIAYEFPSTPRKLGNFSKDIVLKLSFHGLPGANDNSLEVEICIYKSIINKLLEDQVTPNVITYVDSYVCPNFLQDMYNSILSRPAIQDFWQDIYQQLEKIKSKWNTENIYDFNNVNVLMIERGFGKSMEAWIVEERTMDDIRSVFFQILYTLWVFTTIGLQHNDGHAGNIWIEDSLDEKDIYYFVDSTTYYKVPVKYMVKLFDFDLSYLPICGDNKKLDKNFCQPYGVCNVPNPKFDTFLILSDILERFAPKIPPNIRRPIVKFIESVVSPILLRAEWGFPSRLCNLEQPLDCYCESKKECDCPPECNGPYTPPDTLMQPTEQMLKHPMFDPYRYNIKDLTLIDGAYIKNFYFAPNSSAQEVKKNIMKCL